MFGPPDRQISARRLRVLVEGLPLESRTARRLGAYQPGELSDADRLTLELLALGVEVGSVGNYLFTRANVKKGTRVPDPLKVPRPWRPAREDKKIQSSPEEVAAFFGPRLVVRYTPKEEDEVTEDARE